MHKIFFAVFIALGLHSMACAKTLDFGDVVDVTTTIKISTLLASPANYVDKKVTVAGTIVAVCEKRGCWMNLASDAKFEKLRIKVRDGDMVFPMSAKGRNAIVTGYLKETKLDLKQTKRYKASLAKRLGEHFDDTAVTTGMSIYQVTPSGVTIVD